VRYLANNDILSAGILPDDQRIHGGEIMKLKTVIIFILVLFIVIVLVQNSQMTELQLLFWKVSISQLIVISVLFITGFIFGYGLRSAMKDRKKNRPKAPEKPSSEGDSHEEKQ
jgi:uncharacterized integral membrane protein